MKKGTKIGLGVGLLLLGTIAVTSCTQSFCSATDTARIMYAYDPGITHFEQSGAETITVNGETGTYTITNVKITVAEWDTEKKGFYFGEGDGSTNGINAVITSCINSFISYALSD